MKASDVEFFRRYHTDKATELREGIMAVLKDAQDPLTREELMARLPEGAHTYVVSDQPKALDAVLGNLERDGLVTTARKGRSVAYRRTEVFH